MNKRELKETLKPLIKECIKEVIFEDGVLSGIIAEVIKGTGTQQIVVESKTPEPSAPVDTAREEKIAEMREAHRREIEDQRNGLNEAVAKRLGGINVFEGTTPIAKAGQTGSPGAPTSPLQGIDPSDPGVDLSRLGMFGK